MTHRTDDARCHWDPELGQRMLATHQRECVTAGCMGCQPCTKAHCRCGRHLRPAEVEGSRSCAHCVGVVRQDIERIRDLCRVAPAAAAERSDGPRRGAAPPAVMVLAGPIPELSTYQARHWWAINGGLCQCAPGTCPDKQPADRQPAGPTCEKATCGHPSCERINGMPACPGLTSWLENADVEEDRHPLWVLGTWDDTVAKELGHQRTDRATVDTSAAYLLTNLTYLARLDGFGFDELAREVESCREYVENVMGFGVHVQRGAPCPACRDAGRTARSLERTYAAGDTDAADQWVCPTKACQRSYTLDEYAKVVYVDYLGQADRLTAAQVAAQYRIPEGTLRRWANGWTDRAGTWHEPTVRKRGYDGQRRQLYDVADVLRYRDERAG